MPGGVQLDDFIRQSASLHLSSDAEVDRMKLFIPAAPLQKGRSTRN